jgi:hypothetical protein
VRPVDFPHSARSDEGIHHERTDACAGRQRHERVMERKYSGSLISDPILRS